MINPEHSNVVERTIQSQDDSGIPEGVLEIPHDECQSGKDGQDRVKLIPDREKVVRHFALEILRRLGEDFSYFIQDQNQNPTVQCDLR